MRRRLLGCDPHVYGGSAECADRAPGRAADGPTPRNRVGDERGREQVGEQRVRLPEHGLELPGQHAQRGAERRVTPGHRLAGPAGGADEPLDVARTPAQRCRDGPEVVDQRSDLRARLQRRGFRTTGPKVSSGVTRSLTTAPPDQAHPPEAGPIRVARMRAPTGPPPALAFVAEAPRRASISPRRASALAAIAVVAALAWTWLGAGTRASSRGAPRMVRLTPAEQRVAAAARVRAAAIAQAVRDRGTDAALQDTIPALPPAPGPGDGAPH